MSTTGAKRVALLLAILIGTCGVGAASATIDQRLDQSLARYITPAVTSTSSVDRKGDYALAVMKLWATRSSTEQIAALTFIDELCNADETIDPEGSNENVTIWFQIPQLARIFLEDQARLEAERRLTEQNRDNIKRVLWQFISPRCVLEEADGSVWLTRFGENKSVIEKATCLLGSMALLPTGDGYDDVLAADEESIEAHVVAWKGHFYEYFRQRGREGLMCEIADGYNNLTGGIWAIVRDMMDPEIGNEPELQNLADQALTLFLADYATDFSPILRIRAVAGSRYYKSSIDAVGADPFRSLTWAYGWHPNRWQLDPLTGWAKSPAPSPIVPPGPHLSNWLVSSYRPPVVGVDQDILKNIAANEERPSYLSSSRRLGRGRAGGTLEFGANQTSDVRRDLWYTPIYALGGLTLKTDATSYMDSGGPSLDRVFGLTFSNPNEPAARIVFYGSNDESGDDFALTCAGGTNAGQLCSANSECPGGSCNHNPQFWVGKREINSVSGARFLVAGRDKNAAPSVTPLQPDPEWGVKLFISNGEPWDNLQYAWEEEWGWLFTQTTGPLGQAYVAIRICEGGYTTIPTYATNRAIVSGHALRFNDQNSPVVIEVASADEYAYSFEDFRTSVILNWAVQEAVGQPVPYDPVTKKVDYVSLAGDHYEFWSNSVTPPRKNGAEVLNPAKTYDGPYVNGDHGRDFVTVGDGSNTITLDFNYTAMPRRDDYQTVALWHMDAIAAGKVVDDVTDVANTRKRDLRLVNLPTVDIDPDPNNGYRTAVFGKSLKLDGTNYGRAGWPNDPAAYWPALDSMVIDFWFKPDGNIGNQTLVSAGNIWELRLEGTNVRFFTWNAAGQVRSRTAAGAGIKNVWHHVHAEISNVSGQMSLTVDGISQPPSTGNNMKTASAAIEVGVKSGANPPRYFAGRIDDMKIRRWSDQ